MFSPTQKRKGGQESKRKEEKYRGRFFKLRKMKEK